MYEELYAPLPDKQAYLKRIGLDGQVVEPTVDWLNQLVHAQLTHIPFEALDVWGRGECPNLAIEPLFDKIINRRRGGYCFELNSLFCSFLKAVGFECYLVIVYLVGGRDYISPPAHCGIVCEIQGNKYFCDVGFGGPVPDGCVAFDGTPSFGYKMGQEGLYHCVDLIDGDKSSHVMLFHDIPALPVDLIPLNFNVSQRADSGFRNRLMLNFRLENGSVSIGGTDFHLHDGDIRVERKLIGIDDLQELIEKYFGIPANEPPLRELNLD